MKKIKRYKLRKEYPSSPKLNTILELSITENTYVDSNNKLNSSYYLKKDIENNTEYWEEVIEKDYEILSFERFDKEIWSKNDDNLFRVKNITNSLSLTESYFLQTCIKYNIYSIKRLSDEEIFTIGDNLKDFGIIQSIHILDNTITFGVSKDDEDAYLQEVTKEPIKQKLFTTEDKVDIFEGDIFYSVEISNFKLRELIASNAIYSKREYIRFSIKEAAQEYIIMNKPILSFNDLLNLKGLNFQNVILDTNIIVGIRDKIQEKLGISN